MRNGSLNAVVQNNVLLRDVQFVRLMEIRNCFANISKIKHRLLTFSSNLIKSILCKKEVKFIFLTEGVYIMRSC